MKDKVKMLELTKKFGILVKEYEKESGREITGVVMSRGKNTAKMLKLWTFKFGKEGKE